MFLERAVANVFLTIYNWPKNNKRNDEKRKRKRKREKVLGNKIGKCKAMGMVEIIGTSHQRELVMGTVKMATVEIIRVRVVWLTVCD